MRSLLVMALALAGLATWTALGRSDDDTKKKSTEGERGFLGIQFGGMGGEAKITGFADESPAEKAGLKEGDVIVKVQDKPIKELSDLMEVMQKTKPGDKLSVTVKRDDKDKTFTVMLGTKPKDID
jgi:carboxyl-terminal processing protease